jgi:hypothetical protein
LSKHFTYILCVGTFGHKYSGGKKLYLPIVNGSDFCVLPVRFFSEDRCFLLDAQLGNTRFLNNYCRNFLENSNYCGINVMGIYSVLIFCVQLGRNTFTPIKNVGKSAQRRTETPVYRLLKYCLKL